MGELLWTLVLLFWEFFKTGLFSVGGGLATIPFLYDIAGRYDWFTERQLADMLAISESTPGPIGVNAATFAGFHAAGIVGGIVATFALVLPSFVIVVLIAKAYQRFRCSLLVNSAFETVRPAAVGLIGAAGMNLIEAAIFPGITVTAFSQVLSSVNWIALVLVFVCAVLAYKIKIHPIWYIGAGAVIGLVLGYTGIL